MIEEPLGVGQRRGIEDQLTADHGGRSGRWFRLPAHAPAVGLWPVILIVHQHAHCLENSQRFARQLMIAVDVAVANLDGLARQSHDSFHVGLVGLDGTPKDGHFPAPGVAPVEQVLVHQELIAANDGGLLDSQLDAVAVGTEGGAVIIAIGPLAFLVADPDRVAAARAVDGFVIAEKRREPCCPSARRRARRRWRGRGGGRRSAGPLPPARGETGESGLDEAGRWRWAQL